MKLYVATKYGRRAEAQELAATLRGAGHEVIASWLDGEPETDTGDPSGDPPASQQVKWADRDLQDLLQNDGLVIMTMPRNETEREAGCHFEAGYAHCSNMPIFVRGPACTCFYHKFPLYATDDDLLAGIAEYEDEKARQDAEHARSIAAANERRERVDASRRDLLLSGLGRNRIME